MTNASTILAVAAVVYDQDSHSEADLAFLDAMTKADREWLDALNGAKINWGPGEAFQAVKRLATRTRDQAYAAALAALEAGDVQDRYDEAMAACDELIQAAAE